MISDGYFLGMHVASFYMKVDITRGQRLRTKKPKSYPNNRPISATGIIVPVKWDVEGNPIQVALSTNDEQVYVIDRRSGKGREIAKLLQTQVSVDAILNDRNTIIVKHYAFVDNGCFRPKTHSSEARINLLFQPKEDRNF